MLRAVGGGARAGAGLGPPTAVASGERGLRGTRAGPAGALRAPAPPCPTRLSGRCLPRAPTRLAFPQSRRRRAAPPQAARGSGGGAARRSRAAACAGRAAPTLPRTAGPARGRSKGDRSGRDPGAGGASGFGVLFLTKLLRSQTTHLRKQAVAKAMGRWEYWGRPRAESVWKPVVFAYSRRVLCTRLRAGKSKAASWPSAVGVVTA